MIVRVFPPGKSGLGLVRYLEHGEAGEHRDRVLWMESRNLPTDDPETAARLMAADARLSVRTQRPVYHFAVSFDPGDPVDRASMCHVVDALLRRLGLEEHQALLVAHKDTEHPHVHVVVNRVHPETHLAWNNSWDWPKIEKVLREQEVELGLRRVPGRFGRVPGRKPAPRLERGDAAFLRSVQERAAHVLLFAWPWAEVEEQLAAAGLAVRIKGGGLTIHDGRREVKASEVHRECSRRHMERRLGRWSTRHGSSVSEPEPVLDPAVDEAVRAFDAYEARVDETTTVTRELLEGLRDQLQHLVSAVHQQETLDATTAALESEAESLRDQLNTSVELAQVGMALGIVQHEFTNTVRGIRSALRKLKPWAEGTPALQTVERELRTGFNHLDTYLNLFTPMSRRLNRDKVDLSGEEIRKYLDEVFGDRLRRHRVDLRSTNKFDTKVVTGFASTFLPSFVNLVDNAIYWVQTGASDERWIQMDANDDGFLISNSGPGIDARIADSIFEFGQTTKPGGRGMGLYISREALRKEGFDLRLDSPGGTQAPVFRIETASVDSRETGDDER